MCRVFHINQWKLVFSSFALLALFNQPLLLSYVLGSWSSVTCSHVPIHRASISPNKIPIQSGHNTGKKGKNRQLLTLLSCSFTTYIHRTPVWQACYKQTFKLKTFKHVKVHFNVKSRQLVHRSDTRCCGHIPDKWVCFCVLYCTELYGIQ